MDSRKINGLLIFVIMLIGLILGGWLSKFLYFGKNKKIDFWGISDNDYGYGVEFFL